MKAKKLPVLNDPIYGFIHIASPLIFDLLAHPFFQRLRRIAQMGFSSLVFPGARHSRFEHALGAMHLMNLVVETLQKKGIKISSDESEAMAISILLHDIGHGPFSHALEKIICLDIHHETISLQLMEVLNDEFDDRLSLAISIYKNTYPRKFMHQLVSSQLDVDRMDYLKRDSFYSGATEGNINTFRIIEMLNVVDDQLVVEEKGIFSIEKFIMARRLMYWQVYLHKTGLSSELLLAHLMRYVRKKLKSESVSGLSDALHYFLSNDTIDVKSPETINYFTKMDDIDLLACLKSWESNTDPILATYSKRLLHRDLLKMKFSDTPFKEKHLKEKRQHLVQSGCSDEFANSFVFSGQIGAQPYSLEAEPIMVLDKSGKIVRFEAFSNLFNGNSFIHNEIKHYLCYAKP